MDYKKLFGILLIVVLFSIIVYVFFNPRSEITGAVIEETIIEEWNEHYIPEMDILSNDLYLILQEFNNIDPYTNISYYENVLLPKVIEFQTFLNESKDFLTENEIYFEDYYFNPTLLEIESKFESLESIREVTESLLNNN